MGERRDYQQRPSDAELSNRRGGGPDVWDPASGERPNVQWAEQKVAAFKKLKFNQLDQLSVEELMDYRQAALTVQEWSTDDAPVKPNVHKIVEQIDAYLEDREKLEVAD